MGMSMREKLTVDANGNQTSNITNSYANAKGFSQNNLSKEVSASCTDKVLSFAESVEIVTKSGFKFVDSKEHHRRYDICVGCSKLKKSRCLICGCFMKLKSKFHAMHCPLGLW